MKKYFSGFTLLYLFVLVSPLSYYFFVYIPQNEAYFIDRAQREIKELSLNFQDDLNNRVKLHRNLLKGKKVDLEFIKETLNAGIYKTKRLQDDHLYVSVKNDGSLGFKENFGKNSVIRYRKKLDYLEKESPDFFYDLFFLDDDLNTYYLRNNSKFKIKNIHSLFKKDKDKDLELNSSLEKVKLGEEEFFFLVFPIENENTKLNVKYIAALISYQDFQQSAYRISNNTKLFFVAFILISFICWPLLKVKLSSKYDGISKTERILLFFSIIIVVLFFNIIIFDYYHYQANNQKRDHYLKRLNDTVLENLDKELVQIDSVFSVFEKRKEDLPYENVHNWYPDYKIPPYPRSLFTLDKEARQEKWSIYNKIKLSDETILREREYFKYFKEKEFYLLDSGNYSKLRDELFLQSVTSISTGKKELVVSKASESGSFVSAITTLLFSFNSVPMPDKYNYSIIDGHGNMIFHSNKDFHKTENFIVESGNNTLLKSAIYNKSETFLDLRYHGRDVKVLIRPINSPYISLDWYMISQYEKESQHILNVSLIIKCTGIYLILLIALFLMKFIYLAISILIYSFLERKKTGGMSFYRVKDFNHFISFSWLAPHENLKRSSLVLSLVNVLALVMLFFLKNAFELSIISFLSLCTFVIALVEIVNFYICSLSKKSIEKFKFFTKNGYKRFYYDIYLWSFLLLIVVFPLSSIFADLKDILNLKEVHAEHVNLHKDFKNQYQHFYQRFANINDKKGIKNFIDVQVQEQYKHNHRIMASLDYSFSKLEIVPGLSGHFNQSYNRVKLNDADQGLLSFFTIQKNKIIEEVAESINRVDSSRINFTMSDGSALYSESVIPFSDKAKIVLSSKYFSSELNGARFYVFIFFICIALFLVYRLISYIIRSLFIEEIVLSRSKVSRKFLYFKNDYIDSDIKNLLAGEEADIINFSDIKENSKDYILNFGTVVLTNIDYMNEDINSNNRLLSFIQKVLSAKPKKLILHSRLHPLVQFQVEEKNRRAWERLFYEFDYFYLPESTDKGLADMNQAGENYYERREIINECISYQFTQKFLWDEDLKDLIRERGIETAKEKLYWYSFHFYQSLWNQCTLAEKVILYNYSNDEILKKQRNFHLISLINKGLLKQTNYNQLDVFSENFEFFIKDHFDKSVQKQFLETEESLWKTVKIPLLLFVLLVVIFLFSTQRELMDQTMSVITGIAAGIPLLFNIFKLFKPGKFNIS